MRKVSYTLAILVLLLLCSCYQDLELDNETTPYTVINCIANTDADILADVSKSWFYTESNPSEHISGLPIEVYVNGLFMGMMNDRNGIYKSNFHPHSGDSICIKTVIEGKEVSANGRMPEKPEITKVEVTHVEVPGIGSGYYDPEYEFVSDTDHQFTYHITFKNPKEKRYYFLEIKVIGNKSSLGSMDYSYDPVFRLTSERINQTLSSASISGQFGLPFSNEGIDGGEYTLTVKETGPVFEYMSGDKCGRVITLYAISEDYYKYVLSLLANDSEASWQGGLADIGLAEPVKIHSNINGGIGIFGCITPARVEKNIFSSMDPNSGKIFVP